jgi:hypothetical protein
VKSIVSENLYIIYWKKVYENFWEEPFPYPEETDIIIRFVEGFINNLNYNALKIKDL